MGAPLGKPRRAGRRAAPAPQPRRRGARQVRAAARRRRRWRRPRRRRRRRVLRRRPGLLLRALRRSDPARHDLVGEHEPRVEPRRRQDAGSPCRTCSGVHVDFHDVWIDPKDNRNHIVVGNDGGVYESWDEGKTLAALHEPAGHAVLPRQQSTTRSRSTTCAAARRTTARCAGRAGRSNSVGIRTSDWYDVGGGDGFQSRNDPDDPNIVYATSQNGAIQRLDLRTGVAGHSSARAGSRSRCRQSRRWRRRGRPVARCGGGGGAGGGGRGAGGGAASARTGTRRTSSARISRTRLYWGSQLPVSHRRSRRQLDAHQPGSDAQSRSARDSDHGQGVGSGDDRRLQQRDDDAQHDRVDRRVAAARRADLRRHRRRQPAASPRTAARRGGRRRSSATLPDGLYVTDVFASPRDAERRLRRR